MSFKKQILSGLAWNGIGTFAARALQFAVLVALARLLSPKDFGVMAMILTFTGFVNLMAEMGFCSALIQKKDLEERHLSSIFWLNIVAGILWAAFTILIAPLVASFYNNPTLSPMMRLISINFLIGALSSVQYAFVTRQMAFRKLMSIHVVSLTFGGLAAITLAYAGFKAWSLIWQCIISSTIGAVLLWSFSSWRPRFQFDWKAVRELVSFSGHLTGFEFINYWIRNLDNILVGKYMGSLALGLYSKAYSTMTLPLSIVSDPVGNVMFPALSSIQEDKAKVKSVYLRAISSIALLTFPMMLGLLVVAQPFVVGIFGQQWEPMVPLLQIFCLLGLVQSIGTTLGWIYVSQGRADLLMRWGVIAGVPLIGSIVIGVWIGTIQAVAVCYTIAGLLIEYPSFIIAGRLIDMTVIEVIHKLKAIFGVSVFMAACVWVLAQALPDIWHPLLSLGVLVSAGAVIYVFSLEALGLRAYLETKRLVSERSHVSVEEPSFKYS